MFVAILVIEYGFTMDAAWETTHWEFCLLQDVKHKVRQVQTEQSVFTHDRISGMEEHLRNIGVEI